MLNLYHAEIALAGKPATNVLDAREAIRRTGAQATVTPVEPVDADNGIWNVHLSPMGLHRHQTEGELTYRLADSMVVVP